VVFGDRLILKLLRKFEPGPSPEVEMGRFLGERAGFTHAARTRGVLNLEVRGERAGFAVIQDYVPNLGDAWSQTVSSLALVFEQVAARLNDLGEPPGPVHPLEVSEEDLIEARFLLGNTMHESELLGRRTGELHLASASLPGDPVFGPQPVSTLYQRSLYQALRSSIRSNFNLLRRRRGSLSQSQQELADVVLGREEEMLVVLRSITTEKIDADRIRIHGDYHLGQVLHTGNDFVIIDFEGEPLRPISERRIKQLGLRDVAGMLRSYQYTTSMALQAAIASGLGSPEQDDAMSSWADAITRWLAAAFLRGYLEVVGGTRIIPSAPRHLRSLLDALLLDKAAYELGYELNHRPDWVDIPLRGLILASTDYR
jgi:maltose alpha-D-glucosyltransferase/alpha-amylase